MAGNHKVILYQPSKIKLDKLALELDDIANDSELGLKDYETFTSAAHVLVVHDFKQEFPDIRVNKVLQDALVTYVTRGVCKDPYDTKLEFRNNDAHPSHGKFVFL